MAYKKLLVLIFSAFLASWSYAEDIKVGDCDQSGVSVSYSHERDYELSCEALVQAQSFFQSLGYSTAVPVNLSLKNSVQLPEIKELKQGTPYAYFNTKTRSIYVSSLFSPLAREEERVYFKVPIYLYKRSEEKKEILLEGFHRSIIVHELSHLYAQHNFKKISYSESGRIGRAVQEYVAYVAQISTMEEDLKEMVLSKYNRSKGFSLDAHINSFIHAVDPHSFGVQSFLHFLNKDTNSQKLFLDNIFSNQFNPDRLFDSY